MQIEWREQALKDLEDVVRYIGNRNPSAAEHIHRVIRGQVDLLADQPGLGRHGRVSRTRELVISGTPYIAAYEVDRHRGYVVILGLRHGARRWPAEFG